MHKIQRTFTVVSNKKVCPQYYRLSLDAGAAIREARPGQFIHIRVAKGGEPFFRRPFSVFRAEKTLDILYDVVGKGTEILSSKRKGDTLDILGPVGTPFTEPAPDVKQIIMIAGGIGVAPFLFFTDFLKKKKIGKILLYGARSRDQILDFKEFRKNGVDVFVSTEDGSVGTKGRVSRLFDKVQEDAQTTMLYACGPKPMLAAVQDFAKKHHLPGQVSCEEVMACGLGACLGCSIPTRSGYKTVCYDGPVFDVHELCF